MTSVIHHGNPGSYKTFAIIQRVLIPALIQGRTIATNIRGFDSLEKIQIEFDIVLPKEAEIIYVNPDETKHKPVHTMARWWHWLPEGALLAIDEGQKVYPTRLRSLSEFDYQGDKTNLPVSCEQAFDEHRHHNWDIYISTTNIAKVHKEIRQVAEVAYRHRDLSNLMPFSQHKWKEVAHDPENSGKSVSHVISSATHKADKRVFNCYKSTKTGKAKQSNEDRSILGNGRLRFIGITLLCAVFILVYNGCDYYQKRSNKIQEIKSSEISNQRHQTSEFISADFTGDKLRTQINDTTGRDDLMYVYHLIIRDKKISNVANFVVSDEYQNMKRFYDVRFTKIDNCHYYLDDRNITLICKPLERFDARNERRESNASFLASKFDI